MAGRLLLPVLPRTADDDVGATIAVDFPRARDVCAEGFIGVGGVERLQHSSVAPGVDICNPLAGGPARHHVWNAIAVGIARGLDSGAELITGRAVRGPQQSPRLTRVDVDAPCVRIVRSVGWRRHHEVVDPVAIDVADVACDPAELVLSALA